MKQWWQDNVIYQIYPKSFKDSNGDGIGDIPGIISQLDYLADLGIGGIWLSPVYASPQVDNGYDISDYEGINPDYGTMADMKQLIAEAEKRDIKIIMDLVVNHTSDQHAWFIDASQSKDSEYRDFYIWRDGAEGEFPNALQSTFSGPAWQFDPKTNQYFLHLFAKEQPDLNWENEKLRSAIYKMMNFWIDLGIGGFRMDVIDLIGKQPDKEITANGPMLHSYIKEMNQATFGGKNFLTVGETWGATPKIAEEYSNPNGGELSMVFQFEHVTVDEVPGETKWNTHPIDFGALKSIFAKWQTDLYQKGWNSLFWNNHDLPRAVSHFGNDKEYRERSAKMLAIVLHGQQGTPYIYQGEEIGLTNTPVTSIDEVNDIEARNMYNTEIAAGKRPSDLISAINQKSRDNARRPLPWNAEKNGGFTTGNPWLPLNPSYQKLNFEEALANPNSIFYTYKKLVELRKENPILVDGKFQLVDTNDSIFAYTRTLGGKTWLVVANWTANEEQLSLPEFKLEKIVIHNIENKQLDLKALALQPYEAFIAEVITKAGTK